MTDLINKNQSARIAQRGFTLIELAFVIMLVGGIALALTSSLTSGLGAYSATRDSLDGLAQLRISMERIAREVRNIRAQAGAYEISTRNSTQLVFTNWDGVVVSIDGSNLPVINMSYDTVPGVVSPLVNKVASFNLAYFQLDGVTPATSNTDLAFVEISLAIQNAAGSLPQRTRIAMRLLL